MEGIQRLLERRGAEFEGGQPASFVKSAERARLARAIAKRYQVFDRLRPLFGSGAEQELEFGEDRAAAELRDALVGAECVVFEGGRYWFRPSADKVRFLTGGWLEEYVGGVVDEAGADAVLVGQVLHWQVDGYHGNSEIDVIARRANNLLFVSCKSVKAELHGTDSRRGLTQRQQLMGYLNEADNVMDHFGMPGDAAALVVTTDLVDENNNNRARYSALFGRAIRLDVELVTLESLRWIPLVERFRGIIGRLGRL